MFSGRLVAIAENSWPRVCGSCRSKAAGSCSTCGRRGAASGSRDKISAYALQEQGLDTVEANLALGLPEDVLLLGRSRDAARPRRVTGLPPDTTRAKIEGLKDDGLFLKVVARIPLGDLAEPLES